jgi:hypothetical protein
MDSNYLSPAQIGNITGLGLKASLDGILGEKRWNSSERVVRRNPVAQIRDIGEPGFLFGSKGMKGLDGVTATQNTRDEYE